MAKKTHLKVRMVPESKPDSAFVYYANTRKHEYFVEKKLPPHSK